MILTALYLLNAIRSDSTYFANCFPSVDSKRPVQRRFRARNNYNGDSENRFKVAQTEELSLSHLPAKQASILEALGRHCHETGSPFAALRVAEINPQDSLRWFCGAPEFLRRINLPIFAPWVWNLPQGRRIKKWWNSSRRDE